MKLTTGIRKRFRVSNKVKRVAPKDRFRLCISRSAKIFLLRSLMIIKI
jgi:large subunit ribosomal protein L18